MGRGCWGSSYSVGGGKTEDEDGSRWDSGVGSWDRVVGGLMHDENVWGSRDINYGGRRRRARRRAGHWSWAIYDVHRDRGTVSDRGRVIWGFVPPWMKVQGGLCRHRDANEQVWESAMVSPPYLG